VISVLLQALVLGASAMVALLILRFILTSVIKIVREHERASSSAWGASREDQRGQGYTF
jgi:hypothetical protein